MKRPSNEKSHILPWNEPESKLDRGASRFHVPSSLPSAQFNSPSAGPDLSVMPPEFGIPRDVLKVAGARPTR